MFTHTLQLEERLVLLSLAASAASSSSRFAPFSAHFISKSLSTAQLSCFVGVKEPLTSIRSSTGT